MQVEASTDNIDSNIDITLSPVTVTGVKADHTCKELQRYNHKQV
ncbi:MAG: hypothetical protein RM368_28900 [Nostoc sp. DedSLP03]|nr:hypothetical protein [Nostoc sp. DedSLP03]MDZ7968924.1 hypothetical protein [Nostoc sp. DedSLP03]